MRARSTRVALNWSGLAAAALGSALLYALRSTHRPQHSRGLEQLGGTANALALISWGLRLPTRVGVLPFAAGALLLARGARGSLARLLPAGRRAIELDSEIHVAAPVEDVFAFWSVIENFPRFMSHVRDVSRVGPRHYHWRVDGPAGVPVEWKAELSAFAPPERIAWRSVRGSPIRTSGGIRFDRRPDGSTRVRVRMHYHPPAGAIGHALARLLGADPQRQMDEDLQRFKALLETGQAGAATRRELEPSTLAQHR